MMLLAILFLMSIWLTASFQTAVSISEGFLDSTEAAATFASVILGILSTVLPVVLTIAVFAIVYHHLPNTRVEWRDATFGAVVAVVLFEGVKYVSFWFTGVIAERSAIYGPVACHGAPYVGLYRWSGLPVWRRLDQSRWRIEAAGLTGRHQQVALLGSGD